MTTRKSQSKHWQSDKTLKIVESYWTSPPARKRSQWFVEQLKNYSFGSIFEVGFFAGRNLKYITEEFPTATIAGLEINPKATKFAKDKLPNANLLCMDFHFQKAHGW